MTHDLDPKRFPRISLDRQAAALNLGITELELQRAAAGWLIDGKGFDRPEDAVVAALTTDGGLGSATEGLPVLLWIKCAAFETLAAGNTLGHRDTCTRYTEALCKVQERRADQIITAAEQATKIDIFHAYNEVAGAAREPGLLPTKAFLGAFHDVAAPFMPEIMRVFMRAPYEYRAGWPDVTIIKNGDLRLCEVKTTDKIHKSQRRIIEDIGKPCRLPIEVVRLSTSAP